jgi:FAD-linked oxidoreductase
MKRRDFLTSSLGLAAGALLPGCDDHGASRMPQAPEAVTGPDGRRRLPWQNWSGYQHCLPAERVAPASLDELVSLLRTAPGPIRPVGAGHSFTPLVPTEGTIVSLRNFEGMLGHDATAMTATFGAGTRLGDAGEPLAAAGQALFNMPDIDQQSFAGAMATATHGTGQTLGALHAYLTALTLVTPRGDVIACSRDRNREVFDAARVSLGALGVITQLTLRNLPSHVLKRRVWLEPVDELIERFDELAARHHSFEIYLIPHCSKAVAITIDPTSEPVRARGAEQDNDAVMEMKQLRDWTAWWPGLRRRLMDAATENFEPEESVDVWYRMFPSSRAVRFNEMEYHLPREALLPTLRRVRDTVESRHPEIFFPIEVRTVKGDDAWLSPFTGHPTSGSIAVHHYHLEDPLPYFASIEPLLRPQGGRPHWGKMHTLDGADLAALYPRWDDFRRVRRELDPEGRMLNPHLQRLFGA